VLLLLSKHSAPAVVYPIGRSRSQYWFSWILWLAGLLLVLLWFSSTRRLDWRIGLGCVAVLGSGWALRQGWRNAASGGQLVWDGSCWRWESIKDQTVSGELELSVVADLQRIMVVMLDGGSGRRFWFCPERSAFPERWLDFRRAVYSVRKTQGGPAGIDHATG
jgi:toxin CptA